MHELIVFLRAADREAIKAELTQVLPEVKSMHRCEAIARGLGFRTEAALLAALRAANGVKATTNGVRFCSYLREKGFDVSPLPFRHAVARVAIRAVIARMPKLTRHGVGVGAPQRRDDGRWESVEDLHLRARASRDELLGDAGVDEVLRSLAFLAHAPATRTIRPRTSSYWIKHIAENYVAGGPGSEWSEPGYVANGSLIAAALHLGFLCKTSVDEFGWDRRTVTFNMSNSALVELDIQYRPHGARAEDRRRRAEERAWRSAPPFA